MCLLLCMRETDFFFFFLWKMKTKIIWNLKPLYFSWYLECIRKGPKGFHFYVAERILFFLQTPKPCPQVEENKKLGPLTSRVRRWKAVWIKNHCDWLFALWTCIYTRRNWFSLIENKLRKTLDLQKFRIWNM